MSKLQHICEADRREFLKTAAAAAGAPGVGSLPSLSGGSTLKKFAGLNHRLVDAIMRNALLNVTKNSELLKRGASVSDGLFKGSELFGFPSSPQEDQILKTVKISKDDIAQYLKSNPEAFKHFYLEAVNFQNSSGLKETLPLADQLLGGMFSKYEQAKGAVGVLRDLFDMFGKSGSNTDYPLTNGIAIRPALQKLAARLPEIAEIFGNSLDSPDMHEFMKKAHENGLLDKRASKRLQDHQRGNDDLDRRQAAISQKRRQEDKKQADKELKDRMDYEDQLSRWEGEGGSVLESRLNKALAKENLDRYDISEGLLGNLAATAGLALAGGPDVPQARQMEVPRVQKQEINRPAPYMNLKTAQAIINGAKVAIQNINTLEAVILPRLYDKDGQLRRHYYSAGERIAGNVYEPRAYNYQVSWDDASAGLEKLRQDFTVLCSYTPADIVKTFTYGGTDPQVLAGLDNREMEIRQRQLDRSAKYLKDITNTWSTGLDANPQPVELQIPAYNVTDEEEKKNDDFIATYYRWMAYVDEFLPRNGEGSILHGIMTTLDMAVGDKPIRQEERHKSLQIIKEDIESDIKSLCQAYLDVGDFSDEGLLPIRMIIDMVYNDGNDVPDDINMPSNRTWRAIFAMQPSTRSENLTKLCNAFVKLGKFGFDDVCEKCQKDFVTAEEEQVMIGDNRWTNWCYDCLYGYGIKPFKIFQDVDD